MLYAKEENNMKNILLFTSLLTLLFSFNTITYAENLRSVDYNNSISNSSQDNTYFDTVLYDKNSFIELFTVDKDGNSVLGDKIKIDAILNGGINNDTDYLIVYGLSDVKEISQVIDKLNEETNHTWSTPISVEPYSGIIYDIINSSIQKQNQIKLIVFVNDVVPGLTSSEIASYSASVGFDSKPYVINLGDTNGDYIVDSTDASDILSAYAKLSTGNRAVLSDSEIEKMDIDKDGMIDSTDASLVLSYYAYISTSGSGLLGDYIKNNPL